MASDSFDFRNGGGAVIVNSTLVGQIYNSGTMQIGSTILGAAPAARGTIHNDNDFGTVISLGHNLSSDDAGGLLTNATDQVNSDPMLGPSQDNGGPTLTHAFISCSPAIDAGKNFSGGVVDQRGLPRSYDDPAKANANGSDGTDIGAFEAQSHVSDITPPTLICPADISMTETPGIGSRVVMFAPVGAVAPGTLVTTARTRP